MSPLVPVRDPHEGVHPWNGTCGPVRGDFSWCQARRADIECPDCHQPWPETSEPCPGCGITIESIAETVAAFAASRRSS